jgi:sulfur carrier protein
MKILVNGDRVDVGATDLASALKELGYGDAVVATALNGEFISASSRSAARLTAGDRLEILAPMQGG